MQLQFIPIYISKIYTAPYTYPYTYFIYIYIYIYIYHTSTHIIELIGKLIDIDILGAMARFNTIQSGESKMPPSFHQSGGSPWPIDITLSHFPWPEWKSRAILPSTWSRQRMSNPSGKNTLVAWSNFHKEVVIHLSPFTSLRQLTLSKITIVSELP